MGQKIIDIKEVINASGRMTKLGVSTPTKTVLDAMNYGAMHYVMMDELLDVAGTTIANYINATDVAITASASSGIVLTIASLIAGENITYIEKLHQYKQQLRTEIILLKGHNVNYGVPIDTMIELGGGTVKEVGSANQATIEEVKTAISAETIALFYVKSHHAVQKNMVSLSDMLMIAREAQLPLIVDAAAEEDFEVYLKMGADYVIYSGTKALEGPTSGFVATNTLAKATAIKKQYMGIGRAMKVGKESIYGLVQAVKNYYDAPPVMSITENQLLVFIEQINTINGLDAFLEADEAGRAIKRVAIMIHSQEYGKTATELAHALEQGKPAIFTRDYYATTGKLVIDPRPLAEGDLDVICQRMKEEAL